MQGQIDHRLAEVIITIDVFHRIDLIDDVHEMTRFGNTPEHSMGAHQQLPVATAKAVIGFAQVYMTAPIV